MKKRKFKTSKVSIAARFVVVVAFLTSFPLSSYSTSDISHGDSPQVLSVIGSLMPSPAESVIEIQGDELIQAVQAVITEDNVFTKTTHGFENATFDSFHEAFLDLSKNISQTSALSQSVGQPLEQTTGNNESGLTVSSLPVPDPNQQ